MTVDQIVLETIKKVKNGIEKAKYSQVESKFVTLGEREFDAMEQVWSRAGTNRKRIIEGLPYVKAKRWTGVKVCQNRVRTGGAYNK